MGTEHPLSTKDCSHRLKESSPSLISHQLPGPPPPGVASGAASQPCCSSTDLLLYGFSELDACKGRVRSRRQYFTAAILIYQLWRSFGLLSCEAPWALDGGGWYGDSSTAKGSRLHSVLWPILSPWSNYPLQKEASLTTVASSPDLLTPFRKYILLIL